MTEPTAAGIYRSEAATAHRRWPARTAIWLVWIRTAYKMSEGFGFGMGCMEVYGARDRCVILAGMKNSAERISRARPRSDL